jgi:hypothetical protein
MDKYKNVKVYIKPAILKHLGIIYSSAQALFGSIWMPEYFYQRFLENDPIAIAVYIHEETHILRARTYGQVKWYLKYIICTQFRLDEELEAIKAQLQYLKLCHMDLDLEQRARWLSSWLYGNMISERDALVRLKNLLQ